MLGWNDLCGLTRTRAVPLAALDRLRMRGLGWAAAGTALTPFGGIADNAWGPMEEVRHVPVDAAADLPADGDWPPFHLVLTEAQARDGSPSDTCPRQFCVGALDQLRRATGWTFYAGFEHEFTLRRPGFTPGPAFSLEALRRAAPFAAAAARALSDAGLDPETVEPEYGVGQYEVSCGPAEGVAAADRAVLTREVLREVARRAGWALSLSPKFTPEAVGSGQHIHFSFRYPDGSPALPDLAAPALINAQAGAFAAGVLRHAGALCALVAPAPVSYLRLGPKHWSCGYAAFGVQNREAALRVCPPADGTPAGVNLEFRPPDGLCNPYLAIGAIVLAGLAGIRDALAPPALVQSDPYALTPAERAALGVQPLPSSLGRALTVLEGDAEARAWLPPRLLATFLAIKRAEIAHVAGASSAEMCGIYAAIY
jgi:glutamine synthetase